MDHPRVKINGLNTVTFSDDTQSVLFSINTNIFSLDIITSAANVCLDSMYIFIDGDPHAEVFVEIRCKEDLEGDKLYDRLIEHLHTFNKELFNYSTYKIQSDRNESRRLLLLKSFLIGNDPNSATENAGNAADHTSVILDNEEQSSDVDSAIIDSSSDDVENILHVWEESEEKIIDSKLDEPSTKG